MSSNEKTPSCDRTTLCINCDSRDTCTLCMKCRTGKVATHFDSTTFSFRAGYCDACHEAEQQKRERANELENEDAFVLACQIYHKRVRKPLPLGRG